MVPGRFRFDRFMLDPANRRLTESGAPVDLNARYLDALALLVRNAGQLVTKERFLDEVWRGVPVTDEALTQCIKTIAPRAGRRCRQSAADRDGAQAWLSLYRGGGERQ